MNDFIKHEMSNYTDQRLLTMIKQAHNFDSGAIQVAKNLALERNLATAQQLDSWANNSRAQTAQAPRRSYTESGDDDGISPWTILAVIVIFVKLMLIFAR